MRRTLIQFDDETYHKLRRQAFRQERSMSSVVREIVGAALAGGPDRERPKRISQFLSVRAGRSKQGGLAPVSERHDEALAAAFET